MLRKLAEVRGEVVVGVGRANGANGRLHLFHRDRCGSERLHQRSARARALLTRAGRAMMPRMDHA